FPAQARLTAVRDAEQPRLITWQIEEEGDAIRQGQRASRRGWQIVAELGRDLRIAAPPGGGGTVSPSTGVEGQP
ncbi:MAG: hypothetical protein JNG90_15510, partial [Planctomycetaceae bacterium]|nr:hypothetical protein [Planctomycetaceae bacterium]